MPTLAELRRRYEKEQTTFAPRPGFTEIVEPDSRANLSPKEVVDQKLRAALFARDPEESNSKSAHPLKPR